MIVMFVNDANFFLANKQRNSIRVICMLIFLSHFEADCSQDVHVTFTSGVNDFFI